MGRFAGGSGWRVRDADWVFFAPVPEDFFVEEPVLYFAEDDFFVSVVLVLLVAMKNSSLKG